ncbi:MAG: DUF202 domain-containing protein [Acidithiobacillus caldus]|uniref:DUF202 domain-containing protein n=1 Tax=Acidithiobacillus caldus TaxID=33059 RepID=UPI0028154DEE|nr:DUF202 domain-containing protein [Acidithiobacillus caldus]WMT47456.1 MAG: DUF202 domain-containing protein [Acidithiobacillus caldus]
MHRYPATKLVLRDWLAADRTAAGNRRTFYSYLRTTLDFNIAGLVLIRFYGYGWIIVLGVCFLAASVFLAAYAVHRFLRCADTIFNSSGNLPTLFPHVWCEWIIRSKLRSSHTGD